MNAFSQILAHWSEHREEPLALVTITRTQGSTYRKAGARMLVDFQGHCVGVISGGCLEEEIALRAKEVMRTAQAATATFDTRRLFGCNGALDILIEPVLQETDSLLPAAAECFQRRAALVGSTLFEADGRVTSSSGSYALLDEKGQALSTRPFLQSFSADAAHVLDTAGAEKGLTLESGATRALLQFVAPPLRLVVCGTAPDAIALALLAVNLGWQTSLVAPPSHEALDLPRQCRVWRATPEALGDLIPADQRTFVVVMSHHYGRDLAFLQAALAQPFRYVGLLGPSSRRQRLLAELGEADAFPTETALRRLYSPAGLDLGADSPEEVALSIVSEIQAVARGHAAGHLRDRQGAIHEVARDSAAR